MSRPSDVVADTGMTTLAKLAQKFDLPEFVKSAAHAALTGKDLPARAYADDDGRRLPCHNAAATCVSAAYFFDSPRAYTKQASRVESRLLAAADHFGVRGEVDRIREKAAACAPPESDDVYAAVLTYPDGRVERRLPIRSPEEARTATDYLQKYAADFRYADRVKIASRILAKSEAESLPGPSKDFLQKTAGLGTGPVRDAAEIVYTYAWALKTKEAADDRAALTELGDAMTAHPKVAASLAFRQKLAAKLADLSEQYGIRGLPQPETLFPITPTTADTVDRETVKLASGHVFRPSDLAKVDWTDTFGSEFAGLVPSGEKIAAAAASLSPEQASVLVATAAADGVAPLWYEAD